MTTCVDCGQEITHTVHNCSAKIPPAPVKPLSGWQCPVCHRVFAPFVPQCSFCSPRRNYEVLDKHVPRDGEGDPAMSTTLRHGVTVSLPGGPHETIPVHEDGSQTTLRHGMEVTLQTTNHPLRCYRCGAVIVGDVGYKDGAPHCGKCAPEAGPIFTASGSCERCGKDINSVSSHTTNGSDRLCETCFTHADQPGQCSRCKATFGDGVRWFSGPSEKPVCFACTKIAEGK